MDPLRTPPAVAACLTVIRESGADTATKTVVCHSIRLWAPAYHALRLTLSESDPRARERPRPSSLVVQTVLALAETIVEGIAETFCAVFHLSWTRLEVSHLHLIATFPDFCTAHQLAGDTDALYACMRTVHTCLHACRQASRAPRGIVATSPAPLPEVMTALEQYIRAMLTFFAQNFPHALPARTSGALPERARLSPTPAAFFSSRAEVQHEAEATP